MTRQQEIIEEVAKKHGITKSHANEIFVLYCRTIRNEIVDSFNDKETNEFKVEDGKVISIAGFGKIVPNEYAIKRKNEYKNGSKLRK